MLWIQIHWIGSGSRILAQFWSGSGSKVILYNQFWKKKIKIILENNFLWNKYIFLNNENKLSPKDISWVSELLIVKSSIFCLHFNLYLHVWIRIRIPNPDPYFEYVSGSVFWIRIRIQEAPEYGSNTDPDPQHCNYQFRDSTE